ncbi:MAG TPA: hypothetical protein ENG82_03910, partial [Bacteroidetes bacterium]|nr:hypothetical protein [Bacteroidota bacterium]
MRLIYRRKRRNYKLTRPADVRAVKKSGKQSYFMSREKTTIYRKGLGVQDKIKNRLEQDYFSGIVSYLKAHDFTLSSGGLTIYLAREFGFCYGVERAVNYAYQTREKFPDRRIFLIGDMIHNPFVNRQLREMQIEILPVPETGKEDYSFLKIG